MKSYRVQLDRGLTATASNLSGSSKSKTKMSELTVLATLGRLADIKFPDQYLIPDMSSCRMHESRTRYQLEVKLAGQFRKLDFVSGCGTSVPGVAELVQHVRYVVIDRAWFEKMDDYGAMIDADDPDGVQPRVERFE